MLGHCHTLTAAPTPPHLGHPWGLRGEWLAVPTPGWSWGQMCCSHLPSAPSSIDINPNGLFPPVEFPAPRGTPLISPHIRWDHSQTWDVPAMEDFPSGSSCSSATVYKIGE